MTVGPPAALPDTRCIADRIAASPALASAPGGPASPVASESMTWEVLGGIGGLAAGISLLLLLYIRTKPLVNRWATRRFLHVTYTLKPYDLLTPEQARRLRWKQRLRHRRRRWGNRCYQRLMTLVQRVKAHQFMDAFETARFQMVDAWAPDDLEFSRHLTEDDRGIVLEAAAISHVRDLKQRIRRHRGVRCSGGCGTRFGKRRSIHSFSGGGGGGVEGGWRCDSPGSCREQPTGDHFCGMCTAERRSADAAAG